MISKRIYQFTLLLLGMAMLQLSCCKKPEEQKYLGNYPLGEVKDYLYFKPGSYWVYECDSTLELDSQVMISIDTPWIRKSYIDYQYLTYVRRSYTHNTTYNTYYPTLDIQYCEKCERGFANVLQISSPSGGATDNVFYYPFDSTVKGGGGSSPTAYKGYLPELEVLGKTYKDVRIFKVQVTSGWHKINVPFVNDFNIYTSMEYYWAKDVGIVRVKVFTYNRIKKEPYTHNWNLKRHFIKN